jgi:hypothetical protein
MGLKGARLFPAREACCGDTGHLGIPASLLSRLGAGDFTIC